LSIFPPKEFANQCHKEENCMTCPRNLPIGRRGKSAINNLGYNEKDLIQSAVGVFQIADRAGTLDKIC
jgi:hypothetical protein